MTLKRGRWRTVAFSNLNLFYFLKTWAIPGLFSGLFFTFELQLITIMRYFTDIVGDRKIGKKREVTLIDLTLLIRKMPDAQRE